MEALDDQPRYRKLRPVHCKKCKSKLYDEHPTVHTEVRLIRSQDSAVYHWYSKCRVCGYQNGIRKIE